MQSNSFFSVIIPTYNRATLITKTIESLLAQSYSLFEVIIVDDGSRDNTEAVIQALTDERVHYHKVENGERGKARNIGTLLAKGDYITFIDSDDIAYPNHLQEAALMVAQFNRPEVFHLAYEMQDTTGEVLFQCNNRQGDLRKELLNGNSLSCIGIFLKKEIAQQYLFEEDRKLAGSEDWHLWLRLAARFPIHYSNTITACMINHESRSVLNFNKEQMLDRTNLLKKYLAQDTVFLQTFGKKGLSKIEAHMYTYIALHSVLAKDNVNGLVFLAKGIELDISELFQRRTLAIFKYVLLNLIQSKGK